MTHNPHSNVPIILSEITYLEMTKNPQLKPADLGEFTIKRVERLTVAEYLDIYSEVGRDYLWNYRPGQTEEEIASIINSPSTWMYLLFENNQTVGMAELDATNTNDIELVHFGLIPRLLNKGIGKSFLQCIMSIVWETNPQRMWLSTCGLDHPKAVGFYKAAGFIPFKTKIGEFKDWRFSGFYKMTDAPQIPFGKIPDIVL